MNPLVRPLAGCRVGLSISESEDSARQGYPKGAVNRTTLRLVTALFGQGVGVVFGHDWREDGVMEAVHGFAQLMQATAPPSASQTPEAPDPLLYNLVPWPDAPRLSAEEQKRLHSTLRVKTAELPEELRQFSDRAQAEGPDHPLFRYLRARGLTRLRRQLDQLSDARLCLGGKTSTFTGRYPGIVEEALIALENQKPLYLAGLLGGATRQVIDAIDGKPMPRDFCKPAKVEDLGLEPPFSGLEGWTGDAPISDPEELWARLSRSMHVISQHNRLTLEENQELFHTPVLDRVIQLVLTGLSRFWNRRES